MDNETLIRDLIAPLQPLARTFLEKAKELGYNLRITEGYRSNERQAQLYAQGRTTSGNIITFAKPGESYHNTRRAFDVVDTVKGYNIDWARLGALGKSLGLVWGGDFPKLVDRPHFEYRGPAETVTTHAVASPFNLLPYKSYGTEREWFNEVYNRSVIVFKQAWPSQEDQDYAYAQWKSGAGEIHTVIQRQFLTELQNGWMREEVI